MEQVYQPSGLRLDVGVHSDGGCFARAKARCRVFDYAAHRPMQESNEGQTRAHSYVCNYDAAGHSGFSALSGEHIEA